MKTAFKITNIVMLAVTLIYLLASTVIGILTGDILSLLFALLPILLTVLMNISGIKGNYKSSVTVSIALFFIYLLFFYLLQVLSHISILVSALV